MSKIENHKLDCYHYKDSKAVGCCCVCAGVGERVWVWVHSHSSLFAGVSFITRSHQVGKEPRRGLVCACVYVLIRLMRAHQSLAITKLSFHFSPSLTPVIYHAVGLFLHMQIISQVKRPHMPTTNPCKQQLSPTDGKKKSASQLNPPTPNSSQTFLN